MPKRILLEEQRDFSGGLNLQVDPFDLEDNESPRIENVDLDRRGGFGLRRGRRLYISVTVPAGSSPTASQVESLIAYYRQDGTRQLLVSNNAGRIYTFNGTTWDLRLNTPAAVAGVYNSATMGNRIYLSHTGLANVHRWDGTTMTLISGVTAFNDDLTNPVGGLVPPRAATLAVHANCMWAANVFEVGPNAQFGSRIRWSHPGQPEDWRTNDFIDIDPEDNAGPITAILPFQERLLVFKRSAVYAIHGYPPNGFSVTAISREVGAGSQQSVRASERQVFFEDPRRGLMSFDGTGITWEFERVFPVLEDSQANPTSHGRTALAYFNERVWCSMPWLAAPFAGTFQTLVFDPRLNANKGGWTRYTANDSVIWLEFEETDGSKHLLGSEGLFVFETDVGDLFEDQRAVVPTTREIKGFYQTRWFDADNHALKKRWKRPEIVMRDNANLQLLVNVYADYNPDAIKRSFLLVTEQDGTEMVWNVDDWNEAVWAGSGADRALVERGSNLGNGRAMALGFNNQNQTGVDWRVHGLIMKYIPKRIRS